MHHHRRAFSLVELLVVLAVIALLLSLVVPGLSAARTKARATVCLANQKQLCAAWIVYANDFGSFPVGDAPDYWQRVSYGWGGVHWFGDSDITPWLGLPAERPLNTYVAEERRTTSGGSVFRCPSDTGAALSRTGDRTWDWIADIVGVAPGTCFGAAGTSYAANDWMYCDPSRSGGWGVPTRDAAPPFYRSRLGPDTVVVSPSRFVVLGDTGVMVAGRYTPDWRNSLNLFAGYWHGSEFGNFAFLDGSCRRQVLPNTAQNPDLSFLAREWPSPYAGWHRVNWR